MSQQSLCTSSLVNYSQIRCIESTIFFLSFRDVYCLFIELWFMFLQLVFNTFSFYAINNNFFAIFSKIAISCLAIIIIIHLASIFSLSNYSCLFKLHLLLIAWELEGSSNSLSIVLSSIHIKYHRLFIYTYIRWRDARLAIFTWRREKIVCCSWYAHKIKLGVPSEVRLRVTDVSR